MQKLEGRSIVLVGMMGAGKTSIGRRLASTLGLPFVRMSPDHGTAYDIAGQGLADPASMESALRLAATVAATGIPCWRTRG